MYDARDASAAVVTNASLVCGARGFAMAAPDGIGDPAALAVNATLLSPMASANVLEAFIPQYALFARLARDLLGLDIGLVVTGCMILYGLSTASSFLYTLVHVAVESYWMASITLRDNDKIYDHVMAWLKTQPLTLNNRRLTAETDYRYSPDDEPDVCHGFINFASWWRRSAPKFAPAYGVHWFRHDGRLFELTRSRKEIEDVMPWGTSRQRTEETLVISCFGRSTAPLKGLLQTCKTSYYARVISLTDIHRPTGAHGSGKSWDCVASRRIRPIDTVVLDAEEKNALLRDMDEFLRPVTAAWYAERGIPYRRGYLFHGPPGTGKTSLSFAAAGLFGLDVFCLSLMDPTMSEEDLLSLFADLPTRCIVLLEDVDTAGLAKRSGIEGDKKEKTKSKSKSSSADDSDSDSDAPTRASSRSKKAATSTTGNTAGITLSGLLNAIDGVASHEGRILVLTTNKPGALDAALRRPGRVDREVAFTNATRAQIADLFLRMYAGAKDATEELGKKFAEELEDGVWSPAEIQGFLLTRKTQPITAVQEVEEWARGQLDKKGKKAKEDEKKKKDAEKEDSGWVVPWISAF